MSERSKSLDQLGDVVVRGAKWSALAANIKKPKGGVIALDLALLALDAGSTVTAVFTQNAFCAAPVTVAKDTLSRRKKNQRDDAFYCLINAGNANAGTGQLGLDLAQRSCQLLADALGCDAAQVIPFSTGVIGEPLPLAKIEAAATSLVSGLDDRQWVAASRAIMTTDTQPKLFCREFIVDDVTITLAGIAKGAGMIKPNMATMLSYIVTDAKVAQADLDEALTLAVNRSFNRITVDGDTSTNDACLLAATGRAGVTLSRENSSWVAFQEALNDLMIDLATAIIRDAEGASKFITININGGVSSEECLSVGYTVAESPLVKTAFFASDANWGRILAAVGRAGITDFDIDRVKIFLADHCICENGGRAVGYSEEQAMHIMAQTDISVTIDLGRGECVERIWTSDLSLDYVRINADYRT